ncbi:C-X-C motif chemokine 11-like [Paroedura picta]|uniref:C-X-C motif chemokine 11-like n=1 Tax=Paroedura picta TaxID=143630 RepID=UPI0040570B16
MSKQAVTATLTVAVLLLGAVTVQGLPTSRRGRCLCRETAIPSIHISRVAEVQYHRPSASCDREELIVTLKANGKKKCLSVIFEQGRRIKEAIMKKKK